MIIGVLRVGMVMHGIDSLKGKRSIVKGVKGRLQSRFNVSVAEIEDHDRKNHAVLGIAVVATDGVFLDQQLDAILAFMRNDGRFYLGQIERETFGA
ncbi:MAG TPA: DUF503 domain-containing protein [Phycisphaerales bacterium]|nr:DUF503 domain-containing protein [Phycisphaerales bacterium]